MIKEYGLPVVGTMRDWANMSGDDTDPISWVGPSEFRTETAEVESLIVSLKFIDIDIGTCVVVIDASPAVHGRFNSWYRAKTLDEIAALSGKARARIPEDVTRPDESMLRFNEGIRE